MISVAWCSARRTRSVRSTSSARVARELGPAADHFGPHLCLEGSVVQSSREAEVRASVSGRSVDNQGGSESPFAVAFFDHVRSLGLFQSSHELAVSPLRQNGQSSSCVGSWRSSAWCSCGTSEARSPIGAPPDVKSMANSPSPPQTTQSAILWTALRASAAWGPIFASSPRSTSRSGTQLAGYLRAPTKASGEHRARGVECEPVVATTVV